MTARQAKQRHAAPFTPVQTRPPVLAQDQSFRPSHSQIQSRAYENYVARGRQEGRADSDWLEAQRQLTMFQANEPHLSSCTPRINHAAH